MKPKQQTPSGAEDLFRSRLENIINLRHELVVLAGKIDWDHLDAQVAPYFSDEGRPALPTRFMVGLLLLKHVFDLSDEGICERWVCDPYFQFFTGEEFFQHALPHERSGMTHWRKHVGPDFLAALVQESLRIAHEEGALRTRDLKKVTVDTTVQPKARPRESGEYRFSNRRHAGLPCHCQAGGIGAQTQCEAAPELYPGWQAGFDHGAAPAPMPNSSNGIRRS